MTFSNNLASRYPEIAQEWHPHLNGELTPQDVTPGSDKKVWWQCPQSHDYDATIAHRTSSNATGCPVCAGKKVHPDNCLATLHPEIAEEWHPDKNGELTPHQVTPGSGQKVWWLCPQGHDYEAQVNNRTPPDPTGCPYCSGRRVHQDNCLATRYPEIAQEWHPDKNGELTPHQVTPGSDKKVWWQCPQGHDYDTVINYRTNPNKPTGCPYCAGKRVNAENCLATCYPEIAAQWHPHLNGELTPQEVTANSGKKAWWRCPQGHDYEAVIANRTPPHSTGCPVCAGRQVHPDNCLATLQPEIAQEWHPSKNDDLTPQDVTANSGQKVWWQCPQGHDYEAKIANRTSSNATGCPYCAGKRVNEENCLATLQPEIAQEWHPDKNGELTPQEVTPGSEKKVWWLCPKGHDYEATIAHRTRQPNPRGCPVCAGG